MTWRESTATRLFEYYFVATILLILLHYTLMILMHLRMFCKKRMIEFIKTFGDFDIMYLHYLLFYFQVFSSEKKYKALEE